MKREKRVGAKESGRRKRERERGDREERSDGRERESERASSTGSRTEKERDATRVGSVTLEIPECLECMGAAKVRQVTQCLRAAWLMLGSC